MKDDNTDSASGGEVGNIYISSEQIIQEVQKFRCLYDPADPDNKDRDVVRDAWLSVTEAVVGEAWANLNPAERTEAEKALKKKWKRLRDGYVIHVKRGGLKPPSNKKYARWVKYQPKYFEYFSFLLETEHYGSLAKKINNAPSPPPSAAETSAAGPAPRDTQPAQKKNVPAQPLNMAQDKTVPAQPFNMAQDKTVPAQPFNMAMQKDSTFQSEDSSTSFNSSFMVPGPMINPEPENPDRMFLLSLLPRVSALDSREKMDFQIGIMQILQGYDEDSKT